MAPPQPLPTAKLFGVAVHRGPPSWRHCRPPDRPSPMKCSTNPGRGRVHRGNRSRIVSSHSRHLFQLGHSQQRDTHSKERRRWLPTSALALNVALAPKKPSEPNPPPVTKTQSNPRKKTASKEPSIREEDDSDDSGRDEICREHLTKTRLSAGQGPRRESSGTIRGVKLDQPSTFCHSGFCIRPVARTARVPDLDGGAVLAYRRPRGHTVCTVSPLKPSRSGPWLAHLCKGAAMMPSTFFSRPDMPVLSGSSCSRGIRAQPASAARQSHSVLVLRVPFREAKETCFRSVCSMLDRGHLQGQLPLSTLGAGRPVSG